MALLLVLAAPIAGCSGDDDEPAPRAPAAAQSEGPNIVVVMTDDQTLGSFTEETMPQTTRFFEERGTVFETAIATPPLCCPARASFLTGQYPHNNGVITNAPGYPLLREKESVLPAWLHYGGYRTGFVGKYLNGYELVSDQPAPGWDSWFAAAGYPAYFNYELRDGDETLSFGSDPEDYSTDVFTRGALSFIRDSSEGSRPFFLWLAYNAPHIVGSDNRPCEGEVPQPRDEQGFRPFARAELPSPPSFGERDLSDKPEWLRGKPALTDADVETMTLRWRCTLAALPPVDEGVARIARELRRTGELDDTVLVFLSDNGYFFGEHRIVGDKRLAYGAAAHVPMAISYPGHSDTGRVDEAVGTVDLAPTLLDIAGVKPCIRPGSCRKLDGRSLVPLLEGRGASWPADREVLVELDDGFRYEAVRSRRYLYVELDEDRQGPLPRPAPELYDLREDPHELENLLRADPAAGRPVARRLARRLDALRACAGEECE